MILAVDVDYHPDNTATIAGVLFKDWEDESPTETIVTQLADILPYEPGQFYKRELPCILHLLAQISVPIRCIVVDGYVQLSEGRKGLGLYLYDALEQKIPVIGVAKNAFTKITSDTYLYRGASKKPLYISAAGIDLSVAKNNIAKMHGAYRFPTLLKKVDHLCRGWE